ncbi:hypothetical protein GCM10010178_24800 [Lentzea flava]|uniref:Uncharacterized protein n=1 Tax=Lentzea flava TaxID=103732 RepID=A0ABQ2UIG1_9PSEU|nr:hypothetical protein GCM10010178_24800 [Lentzea flava]
MSTCPDVDIRTFGSWNVSPLIASRKSSSIGSINGEWKACETFNRLFFHLAAMASTSSSTPEITTDRGPLTAAMATPSVRWARTSSSDATTDTIAPPAGNAFINEARAVTSWHASSRLSTPATCAAAISPIE